MGGDLHQPPAIKNRQQAAAPRAIRYTSELNSKRKTRYTCLLRGYGIDLGISSMLACEAECALVSAVPSIPAARV